VALGDSIEDRNEFRASCVELLTMRDFVPEYDWQHPFDPMFEKKEHMCAVAVDMALPSNTLHRFSSYFLPWVNHASGVAIAKLRSITPDLVAIPADIVRTPCVYRLVSSFADFALDPQLLGSVLQQQRSTRAELPCPNSERATGYSQFSFEASILLSRAEPPATASATSTAPRTATVGPPSLSPMYKRRHQHRQKNREKLEGTISAKYTIPKKTAESSTTTAPVASRGPISPEFVDDSSSDSSSSGSSVTTHVSVASSTRSHTRAAGASSAHESQRPDESAMAPERHDERAKSSKSHHSSK